MKLLNIVSSASIQLELGNTSLKVPRSPQDNLSAFSLLRDTSGKEPRVPVPQEQRATVTPEYIVAALPFALASRANEKQVGWEPVDVTSELQMLIDELDQTPVHNVHSVAVLYIPSDCIRVDCLTEL